MNWDDLRIFLAVAREGGLVGAGRRLRLDHTTVARRLSALEAAAGARLVHRSPRGSRLTDAGVVMLDHAERMEAEALAAGERIGAVDHQAMGTVRLVTPEAFGAGLVAPHVRALRAQHPGIQLELAPGPKAVNMSKREADIGVGLGRPNDPRLFARKLSDYRLGIYAAREYLDAHPPITEIGQIGDHALVSYIDELVDVPELKYLDEVAPGARTVFRSTSITAQQVAVVAGLGLGILHTFAADGDPRLVRVLPGQVSIERSYWLILHADQRHIARIRAVADFLDSLAPRLRSDIRRRDQEEASFPSQAAHSVALAPR